MAFREIANRYHPRNLRRRKNESAVDGRNYKESAEGKGERTDWVEF